jgi:hypothetical protein
LNPKESKQNENRPYTFDRHHLDLIDSVLGASIKRMKRSSIKEQQQACEIWNLKHPIGCDVTVEMDSGEIRATRTRSMAQMLSGHTAVIFLEGIAGCYLLSRVRPKGEVARG